MSKFGSLVFQEGSMYRFAICDDNPADTEYISALVMKWSAQSGNETDIDAFPSAEAFLFAYDEDKAWDVLLLDIEMAGMSGVELAKRLRQKNHSIQIVFVTGYMEYIAEGYDVEALHYLLKPVSAEKMLAVLDRAIQRIKRHERALVLSTAQETVRVPLYEIRYLEVQKNYTTVYADIEYSAKRTLREIEKELDESFFKIHRSYIVNMKYIKRIAKSEVILKDNTVLPLARGLYGKLNQAVIKYF